MKRFAWLLLLVALGAHPAFANFTMTTAGPTTVFAIDAANQGSALCAATSTECPATVLVDKTGTPLPVVPLGQTSANLSFPVVLPSIQVPADPCALHGDVIGTATKTTIPFSSTLGEFQLVAPASLNQIYICAITLVSTAADTISIVSGLTPNCTTGPLIAAIAGSTTAASGMDFAALGRWEQGNGTGTVLSSTSSGYGLCVLQTGTTKIAGAITYVQTPL
jgi:hypothetical protein